MSIFAEVELKKGKAAGRRSMNERLFKSDMELS